jgi:hypothetical protein
MQSNATEVSILCPPVAVPVRVSVLDKLGGALITVRLLQSWLVTEEANSLLWIEPHLEEVYVEIDRLMQRVGTD